MKPLVYASILNYNRKPYQKASYTERTGFLNQRTFVPPAESIMFTTLSWSEQAFNPEISRKHQFTSDTNIRITDFPAENNFTSHLQPTKGRELHVHATSMSDNPLQTQLLGYFHLQSNPCHGQNFNPGNYLYNHQLLTNS